jgi:hypothetical protein
MKIATARYMSNVPEGATIYGVFTRPFGAGVDYDMAASRLDTILYHNGPEMDDQDWPETHVQKILEGLDFPNDGCEVTFVLYSTGA